MTTEESERVVGVGGWLGGRVAVIASLIKPFFVLFLGGRAPC